MGYPQIQKTDTIIYQTKQGPKRVKELQDMGDFKHLFLPEPISIENIHETFLDLIETGLLQVLSSDGTPMPVFFGDGEMWSEFSKTWQYTTADGNVPMPYVIIRYLKESKGTMMGTRFTIPNKQRFAYISVPTFKDRSVGSVMYKIPQPTAIDLHYEIRIFSRDRQDVENAVSTYLHEYSGQQVYIKVSNRYFVTKMEEPEAEDQMEDRESDRFYQRVIPITIQAQLLRESDFEIVEAPNRIITFGEINGETIFEDVTKNGRIRTR